MQIGRFAQAVVGVGLIIIGTLGIIQIISADMIGAYTIWGCGLIIAAMSWR